MIRQTLVSLSLKLIYIVQFRVKRGDEIKLQKPYTGDYLFPLTVINDNEESKLSCIKKQDLKVSIILKKKKI